MGSHAGHGIEGVRNSNDSCLQRNGLAHQSIGVAAAVKMFVMIADHGNLILEKIDFFHNLHAD